MPIKNALPILINARSPRNVALAFALLGLLWIGCSHFFFRPGIPDLIGQGHANLLLNGLFVLISGGILYFLLLRNRSRASFAADDLPTTGNKSHARYLLASLMSLLLVAPLITLGINQVYTPKLEQANFENLRLIAKIKVVQYERWRDSRKGDAEVLAVDKGFAKQVQALHLHTDAEAEQQIAERFDALIAAYEFEGISLLDRTGLEIFRRGNIASSAAVIEQLIQETQHNGQVEFSDLYVTDSGRIQLNIIAPIRLQQQGGNKRLIGFVLIHTGIDSLIVPRVLSWPSASPSSRVLLVKHEAGLEHIIHTARNDKRKTVFSRRPMSEAGPYAPDLEFQQGVDYLGNLVFTSQQPLSKSSWSVVTQVDQAEVMAPLKTLLLWVGLIGLLAVTLVSLALIALWRQQQNVHQLELLNQSSERDRLLKKFFDLPFLGMAVTSPDSKRWLQVNDWLCDMLGYTRQEMLALDWAVMTHPQDLQADLVQFRRCLNNEIQSYTMEKRFLHKQGSTVITHIDVNCTRRHDGTVELFLVAIEDITQRKQAEQALRESEQRLALVLKGSNDGWWDMDLIRNSAYYSPRWWSMLGYEANQDSTDPLLWQRLTHADDIAATLSHLRRVLDGKDVTYELEVRLQHKDGHYVPILTKGYVLRDTAGKALRVSGTNTDLTERKAAEQALMLQEEFNRVLLENQADGVVACDANLKLVLFNHTARDWHGVDAMHIPTDQWGDHFGLYDAEGHAPLNSEQIPLVRAYHGERLQNVGISIRAKGQPLRYISCSAAPFCDAQGKMLGAVAIMRDITALRQQTLELKNNEALYRKMFDANPHPMWVFDANSFAFLAVNDATVDYYGWTREEFLHMSIFDIRTPAEADRLRRHLPELISNRLIRSGEWQHQKKDGSSMLVEVSSHPINFNGLDARLVTAYDITARKQHEQEIRTLNRLLLMLTNINQAIVRRLDALAMFEEACTVAVRDGGFRMAWIGLVDNENRRLRCAAFAGEAGDYIERMQLDTSIFDMHGPTARAIREGRHVVSYDIASDASFKPWRDSALANDYRSMVALPLIAHGQVVGNFSLYSSELGIFNARELDLLDELAGDISFAIEIAEAGLEKQKAEEALQESEAIFHTLASSSPVGILRTDIAGNTLYVNQRGLQMAGLQHNQFAAEDWARATHPEDRIKVQQEWLKAVVEQRGFSMEYRFQHADGKVIWVKGQAETEKDSKGRFLGFVGTITDITALKDSAERLRMSAAVFENTREGVMITDSETHILMVNRAFSEISLFSEQEVIGHKPSILSSGRHDRDFYRAMWQSLNELGHWQGEIWNRRQNGDLHPVLMSISSIRDEAGQIMNYVGVFADIANLKASEAQLDFLAHHDSLTRLPNRLMLISRLGHAIEVARRDDTQLALLMLDLDRFKNVNDSFGHLAGDELLQQVAERLSKRLRGVDTLSRLGGDEFTILLEDIKQAGDAARVAEDVIHMLEMPWKLSNNIEVRISASVGISLFPHHAASALELLQHADAALYQAKSAGRGCSQYFSESLTLAARERFKLEAKLRDAIAQNELCIHYQPQIEISSGQIVGVEALVRWQQPDRGLILPNEFIGIAEETGLIIAIGEWVMREACLQGKRWLDQGLPALSIAINISAHQLHHSDLAQTLTTILAETAFPACYLELELTESIVMQREADVVETLNALRAQGIRLAIDDFGTGYSSLAYLKSFPLDILKIDKSFVRDIEVDADDRAITATVIGIAHTLGLRVIAEGVETEPQLTFLRLHDCDLYQGFISSKALPTAEFVEFLHKHNTPAHGG